jgi:hypothetical protein
MASCSSVRTGVLRRLTTCFGPRTACAGLTARTSPTTSQSNSMRIAAGCWLTVGLASSPAAPRYRLRRATARCRLGRRSSFAQASQRTCTQPGKQPGNSHGGVLVAAVRGEEFEEAAGGPVAGVGDHRRHDHGAMQRGRLLRHRGFEGRQQCAAIPDTLPGLQDRALLLVDFTAARARLPGSKHAKPCRSDGVELLSALGQGRSTRAPHKGRLPVSCTDRYPVKAPDAWLAPTITEGRLFRRICRLPSPRRANGVRSKPAPAPYRVGYANSFALTVQRWLQPVPHPLFASGKG